MYSVETTACQVNPTSASATAVGPSSARDSRNSGIGTTVADQTVRDSPPETPDARETTLPMPQDRAPSRHSVSAATVTWPPRPSATTTSPAEASEHPDDLRAGRPLAQHHGGQGDREDHLRLQDEGRQARRQAGVHRDVEAARTGPAT